jgi:hypothetical protein
LIYWFLCTLSKKINELHHLSDIIRKSSSPGHRLNRNSSS